MLIFLKMTCQNKQFQLKEQWNKYNNTKILFYNLQSCSFLKDENFQVIISLKTI